MCAYQTAQTKTNYLKPRRCSEQNSDHLYYNFRVKAMIENQKKSYGGEFLFVEANIDAVETAKHFGISANRAGDCLKDKRTAVYYDKRACGF